MVGCAGSSTEPDAGPALDAAVLTPTDAGSVLDAAGPDDAGSGTSIEASEYCESIVDAFCPFYLRCGRIAIDPTEPDALRECRRVFLESCNLRYEPRYVQLAEAGLLHLSRTGVELCRQHLGAVECERQVQDLDDGCSAMWVGTQAAGAPCGIDVESFTCGPGTTCRLDLSLCGTCVPVVADGEACGGGVGCRSESQCLDGRCVARGRPGDPCDASAPCVLGASCSGGFCVGPIRARLDEACGPARCPYRSACIDGFCRETGLLGAICDEESPCDVTYCSDGRCEAPRPEDASCDFAIQCASGRCADGLCRALPGACWD